MERYYTLNTEEELLKLSAGAFGDNSSLHFHKVDKSYYDVLDGFIPDEKFKSIANDDLKNMILGHMENMAVWVGLGKSTEKIIFLDIDGVLNHQSMTEENKIKTSEGFVSKECVERLNHITTETGAGIVVSSVWRLFGKENVFKALREAGVTGNLIDVTPRFNTAGSLRGNEIYQWLKQNKDPFFSDYIILDDDSDMLYWQQENFMLVDHFIGITPSIAYKAINKLKRLKNECSSHPFGEIK